MEAGNVNSGGESMVSWVASGVELWSTAFVLVRALFPKRTYEFCNRAVSTMHAVTAVYLACRSVADWRCPVCPLAAASSPRQMQALAVTLSYMLYDAACCHLNGDVRLEKKHPAPPRQHRRHRRRPGVPAVRHGDGGDAAHHGDLEPAAPPPGDAQGARRPGHGPQPRRRRALRRHLLRRADGRRALPHLRHRHGGQPATHQGDGDGAAGRQRILVPPDRQDGQAQARQEEAAAAGDLRRHRHHRQMIFII